MGAMIAWSGNLGSTANGVPAERLLGQRFTASLFELLGVRPEIGRLFTEEEDAVGAPVDVAVISHRLWHTRFAGDPMVINRTVLLDGTATKIVGVMPPGFSFFDDECDYWIPFAPTPFQVRGSSRAFTLVARRLPILRQLVTESMLLAFAGGALGLVLAWGGLRLLLTSSPAWLSQVHDIAIDAQVLAFTTAVSLVTGLGFGVVPALQVSR